MLVTCSIQRYFKDPKSLGVDLNKAVVILGTRTTGKMNLEYLKRRNIQWWKPCGPSMDTFRWYLNTPPEDRNDTWWREYTRRYARDISTDPEAKALFGTMMRILQETDVVFMCFCMEPEQCHRSLVAHWMKQKGFDIVVM